MNFSNEMKNNIILKRERWKILFDNFLNNYGEYEDKMYLIYGDLIIILTYRAEKYLKI